MPGNIARLTAMAAIGEMIRAKPSDTKGLMTTTAVWGLCARIWPVRGLGMGRKLGDCKQLADKNNRGDDQSETV